MRKDVLFPFIPFVYCVLLHHLLYGFDNLGIVEDELADEVYFPQERLHNVEFPLDSQDHAMY